MKKLIYILLGLILLFGQALLGNIINIPSDYTTIQEGINAANDGDTILVADGTYTGGNNKNLTWNGNEKHIVVKSENGAENCIIDCEDDGRGFNFDGTNQDTTDVINGFTLKNGYSVQGAGIYCNSASPKIQNNIITDNEVYCSGGGIGCIASSPHIINNVIKENMVSYGGFPGEGVGGGISIVYGSPILKDNIIKNNESFAIDFESGAIGGGIYISGSSAIIKNNLIIGNIAHHQFTTNTIGGGLYYHSFSHEDCCGIIENNTISSNWANSGSGIRCIGYAIIKNNICCNNSQEGMNCYSLADSSIISYNDVWGNNQNFINCPPGIGDTSWGVNINGTPCDSCYNISEDPLFISGPDGNYFLSQIEAGQVQQSPCVDAGDSTTYYYGLEGYTTRTDLIADIGIVDIGYHYQDGIIVSIDDNIWEKSEFYLTNYPNPFSGSTSISFFAAENNRLSFTLTGQAEIKIYNIRGQLVKQLKIQNLKLKINEVVWDGKDENGEQVPSGIYLCKLSVGKDKIVRKMVLLR